MTTGGGPAQAGALGQIESRVVPGGGTIIYLRGVLDVRLAGELEEKLGAAHWAHPPVTVDLTGTVTLDSAIVDVLSSASATYPEGLRVIGAFGAHANSFEMTQVEHLRAK